MSEQPMPDTWILLHQLFESRGREGAELHGSRGFSMIGAARFERPANEVGRQQEPDDLPATIG